ncbi:phage transcriptional regulator, ArpU family [Schinkia azotoformans MEV2011]|uniref:Phage transcriptional regulator, ArpU family n=1 Tax=Schinkia azotoformans MEV2011 TaxID=1348973 RepID=A0A072NTG5_SCHAZ|nr:ArpU family phage packaging/lysis transcriptional regulator [Schinkia azotoformans]KEF40128.1 phage transcriptional regulator, ArpU family [Schinkia azotoformans MEV2011]
MATQLSLFPDINEKEVRSVVVKELKRYKAWKVRLHNRKEQNEKGIEGNLFPKLLDNDKQNELKVKQIERALNSSLDQLERQIIEMKYLSTERQNDLNIYLELGLQKTPYYEKKKTAIFQIAESLGII